MKPPMARLSAEEVFAEPQRIAAAFAVKFNFKISKIICPGN
jgi:hypothetical protein